MTTQQKTPADFLRETRDPRQTVDSIEQMRNMYPCLHASAPEFWVGLLMVGGPTIQKWRRDIIELIVRTYFKHGLKSNIDKNIQKLKLLVEYVLANRESYGMLLLGKCKLWDISLNAGFSQSLLSDLRTINIYPY